jgi:pilus assembly protein Flp/PilA
MFDLVLRLIKDERGITAIEYSLIGVLISVVAVSFMTAIGTDLSETFETVAGNL